jgi:hypothetical protein
VTVHMIQAGLSNEQGTLRLGLESAPPGTRQPQQIPQNVSSLSEPGCQTAIGNTQAARKCRPQSSLIESSLSAPEAIRASSNLKVLGGNILLLATAGAARSHYS